MKAHESLSGEVEEDLEPLVPAHRVGRQGGHEGGHALLPVHHHEGVGSLGRLHLDTTEDDAIGRCGLLPQEQRADRKPPVEAVE